MPSGPGTDLLLSDSMQLSRSAIENSRSKSAFSGRLLKSEFDFNFFFMFAVEVGIGVVHVVPISSSLFTSTFLSSSAK
jgi:hypothetical protein